MDKSHMHNAERSKKEYIMFDLTCIQFQMSKIMPLKMKEEVVSGREHKGASGSPTSGLSLDFGDGYTGEVTLWLFAKLYA